MQKIFLLPILLFFSHFVDAQDFRSDTIDIRSYNLKLDLSDFAAKILKGDAIVGIKAKMNGVDGIHLDLLLLNVDSVKVNSFTAPFTYNDSVVDINLLATLNINDSATVEIFYHGNPFHAASDFGGFYWTGAYAFNIGVSFLADPHNYGRVWFPCFDNFEERSFFEFYVTTKNTYKAFCNGIMQGVTTIANKKIWHWKLNQEIPSYLASVAVSDYSTVNDTVNGINGTIPVQLAVNAGDTTTLKDLFIHLHNAFHIQETLWGPYQWDRVGYCIVPFNAGAMEHATNIGFMSYYLNILSAEAEEAMAHELSHHWFGDLVTCDSASEMWLNEGWARYNEKLFLEKLYGDSVYKQSMSENHESVLHTAHVKDGSYLPVSGVPTEYTYGNTVYDKGADAIHTLRTYMGDSLFFQCVKNYVTDFAWKNSSTAQLRDYLSQCSGIDLNDFFNDWIYAPGFSHFSIERITPESVQSGTEIFTVYRLMIRQRLNHALHYYENVPIVISYFTADGQRTDEQIFVSGECTEHVSPIISLNDVVYIAIDFDAKLQDAITDEWKIISDTGSYDFGTAKMILLVNTNVDSSLIRIEHNWIRPEPMHTKIAAFHLHDKRYWTVDGITNSGFVANAKIDFDGTDISLDSTFITNSEDSLVVMYRANTDSEWVKTDSFSINTQGNVHDKVGYATVNGIKKGQYCFAIWNSSIPDTATAESDCVFTSVNEAELKNDFQIFPNPTNESVTVSFEKNLFSKVELFDLVGRKFLEQKISAEQNSIQLKLKSFTNGTYLVTLTGKSTNRISKKIIKQ